MVWVRNHFDLIQPACELNPVYTVMGSIQQRRPAAEILTFPFYHPTLEEGLEPALREICEAVHTSPPIDQAGGSLPGG
jgi:dihydrolipoamide dehydrogenase